MKKLYIFDCFGVVLNEVGNVWASNHNIKGSKYNKWRKIATLGDLGKIDKNDVYKLSGQLAGQSGKEFEKEWTEIVTVNSDVVQTIHKLRPLGIKVVLLSNASNFIDDLLRKSGVDDIWDEKFLSYKLGIKKPDPEIFLYVLEKMNTKPEDACFIDDNEINVVAAKKIGIEGVLYPSEEFSKII